MCGICGVISFDGRRLTVDRINPMMASIIHRGPDDSGHYISPDGKAALGFRRLSIIDLSTGHQPLSNEDRKVWIVFNGEIYDFQATRTHLLEVGHRFSTKTDTEVIVHLYEEYGAQCPHHLRGMFGFGIWDERTSSFFAARDRVGKKPFFYSVEGKSLLFGSELKAILSQLHHAPQIDRASLDHYLAFGYIPAPRTIYHNIWKLPPGHWLRFSRDGLEVQQYWKLSFQPEPIKEEELEAQVEKLVREAVRLRLVSDVPLGALLSGGVDSSVVVALMAQEGGRPPKTFSVGFEASEFNELDHARKVAKHVGSEHYEQIVRADIVELLNELVNHFDEPFADSSMIPTYLVCRHAREHITVALSGDGGDEVFGGYPRYLYDKWIGHLHRIPYSGHIAAVLSTIWGDSWRGKQQLRKMQYADGARYAEQMSFFDSETRPLLYHGEGRDHLATQEFIRDNYLPNGERTQWDHLSLLQYLDTVVGYLPGDILTKVDITSMRVSLELRSPLLDQKLIEFMSRVPAHYKIRGLQTKYLLKKIGERLLPRDVLYRPKKGFALPLARWFRNELMGYTQSMLLAADSRVGGMFRREAITGLVHDHTVRGLDCTQRLFCLLCLEIWLRQRGYRAGGQNIRPYASEVVPQLLG